MGRRRKRSKNEKETNKTQRATERIGRKKTSGVRENGFAGKGGVGGDTGGGGREVGKRGKEEENDHESTGLCPFFFGPSLLFLFTSFLV